MDIFDGFLLGLIQGLTEFLPVSSSGHLLIAGRLLGYTPDVAFELVAHLGTLLALILVLYKPLFSLVRHPLSVKTRFVLLAIAVTAAVFLANERFFRYAADGKFLATGFLLTAVLLTLAHFLPKRSRAMGWLDAVVIGFAQGAAGLPGLSRSGTTVSTAQLLGVDRKESTEFSFLLAVPVILGSAAYEMLGGGFGQLALWPSVVCFATSFVTGLLTLKLCLKLFASDNAVYFAVYLALLGTFFLINDAFLHII